MATVREYIVETAAYLAPKDTTWCLPGARKHPKPEPPKTAALIQAIYEQAVIVHNDALEIWTADAIKAALIETRERAVKKERNYKRARARAKARSLRRSAATAAATDAPSLTAAVVLDDAAAVAVKRPAAGDIWDAIEAVSKGG